MSRVRIKCNCEFLLRTPSSGITVSSISVVNISLMIFSRWPRSVTILYLFPVIIDRWFRLSGCPIFFVYSILLLTCCTRRAIIKIGISSGLHAQHFEELKYFIFLASDVNVAYFSLSLMSPRAYYCARRWEELKPIRESHFKAIACQLLSLDATL